MQNYGHLRPGETRAPETEVLPDGRKRLTRFFEVTHKSKIPIELDIPYGTLDVGVTPVAGWNGLRLTGKKITDNLGQPGDDTRPMLLLTFEEIAETAETPVGEPKVSQVEDGGTVYEIEWLQFSFKTDGTPNPPVPQVPGHVYTVAGVTVYLRTEEAPDDGDLRRIKRTYVTSGIIATDFQTKQGGALLIKTITSVVDVPATPSGYTLIGQPTQNPGGLPIYTYTFAKGNGEVSRDIRYSQSSNQGTTGATTVTIRHLTAGSVSANPITPPAGTVLIEEDRTDQDGYRVWTGVYGKGVGLVLDEVDTKEGGKLVIYHRAALGAAPDAPAATISGTVTLIRSSVRKDSGYDIYDYTWAEGNGEVSRETSYSQSNDQGVTGGTIVTITYLSSLTVGSNPITPPGGMALIRERSNDQDGYRLWEATYAKGTGTVLTQVETKNGGKLILYHRIALGSAPTPPSATISGTVTLIDSAQRKDSGYDVFDYTWAEGNGEISRDIDYSQSVNQGTAGLTRTVIRHLTAVSVTTDPTSLAGSINIGFSKVDQDGYRLWTSTYAKGTGTVSSTSYGREDGSVVYEVTDLGAAAATPSYPGSGTGYLVRLAQDVSSGCFINRATYVQLPASIEFRENVDFPMPGLAYFSGTDLILQPPTVRRPLAKITVDHSATQATDVAFTVTTWAGFSEVYTPTATGIPVNAQYGLNGYLAAGVTISGAGTYKGVSCTAYSATKFASSPAALPTGDTVLHVKNGVYLTTVAGTVIFKRTVTRATL